MANSVLSTSRSSFLTWSLRTKLLIAFLLVAFIPLGIIFFVNNLNTSQYLTDNSEAALRSTAAQTGSALDTFIRERLNDVRVSAQQHIFAEYLVLPIAERKDSQSERVLYIDL